MTHTTESTPATAGDQALIPGVVQIARGAGDRLLAAFSTAARPRARDDMFAAGMRNEEVSLAGVREALTELRPGARWVEDDQETRELAPGEWWTVDAVEGNVNHVHGMPEWCVSIALVRDGAPVLAAICQPVPGLLYTAVRGGGGFVNGTRLAVSHKTDLDAAIVATGQAEAGQEATHRRIGASITAMLQHALLVRATVPSTFPMLLVAAGQNDAFWQYEPVLPGIAPGALLITEAGGVVSRIDGSAWRPGSPDILAAAPGLHARAIDVLRAI